MVFSWSSFVAQKSLLAVCARTGLDERHALALGNPLPTSASLTFSLATDDVMVFSSAGPRGTSEAIRKIEIEIEMAAAGIAEHPAKDEDDVLNGVCVGVELVDGTWWGPPAPRMWVLLMAVSWVCDTGVASPAGILAMLDVLQWFDLMRRPKLSLSLHLRACRGLE